MSGIYHYFQAPTYEVYVVVNLYFTDEESVAQESH
jgi:hypothetical protein